MLLMWLGTMIRRQYSLQIVFDIANSGQIMATEQLVGEHEGIHGLHETIFCLCYRNVLMSTFPIIQMKMMQ